MHELGCVIRRLELNFQPIQLSLVAFCAGVSNGRHSLAVWLPVVVAKLILCDQVGYVFWCWCIRVTLSEQFATFVCGLLHILYRVSFSAVATIIQTVSSHKVRHAGPAYTLLHKLSVITDNLMNAEIKLLIRVKHANERMS